MSTDLVLATQLDNPFYAEYLRRQNHKLTAHPSENGYYFRDDQPEWTGCMDCRFPGFKTASILTPIESVENEFTTDVNRSEYAWAVPSDEAIRTIAAHAPNGVVEIGAGLGYWAFLLDQLDVTVHAYDIAPNNEDNHWCKGPFWYPVEKGDEYSVEQHQDAALLLCWPPYDESMAYNTLCNYEGDTLIYVGEGHMGCTADSLFFAAIGECEIPCDRCRAGGAEHDFCSSFLTGRCEALDIPPQGWKQTKLLSIPQWYGLNDYLAIYRR